MPSTILQSQVLLEEMLSTYIFINRGGQIMKDRLAPVEVEVDLSNNLQSMKDMVLFRPLYCKVKRIHMCLLQAVKWNQLPPHLHILNYHEVMYRLPLHPLFFYLIFLPTFKYIYIYINIYISSLFYSHFGRFVITGWP